MVLIDRISSLMSSRGIASRTECEKLCGIANGAIGKWEAGAYGPSRKSIEKVAIYFGVSIGYLLGETDDPRSDDHFELGDLEWAMFGASRDLTDDQKRAIIEIMKNMNK